MTTNSPAEPQPITIGEAEPIAVQLVDLTPRYSKRLDPHHNILSVWLCIECGHAAGGPDPHLIPVGPCWDPPEPISEEDRWRWIQTEVVARDLFDVRPRLMAEVEQITSELAILTFWAVSKQPAPGCRRVVFVRGEWRLLP
jgi:hypothetical protein